MADKKIEKSEIKATAESKVVKTATKAVKAKAKVTIKAKTESATKTGSLTVTAYSMLGKESGSIDLPKVLFGEKVNDKLLTQALRVYVNNQQGHWSNTKTRGEVMGSTRKIYKQKGTGRARHGAISAPIFVGGGVTFAARPREFDKRLSKKMRLQALASALTTKMLSEEIVVAKADDASGKTKEIALAMKTWAKVPSKKTLFIVDGKNIALRRAAKNISGITTMPADSVNTYEVLRNNNIVITTSGLDIMKKHFLQNEKVGGSKQN